MQFANSVSYVSFLLSLIVQPAVSEQKWNILWLSCEDIDPILSCYGAKGIKTPNIDRLANEGIKYTNAYATVAVSAASRSSIITGMYPASIGTMNHRTGPHAMFRQPENEVYKNITPIKDQLGRNIPEYSAVLPVGVKCFTEYLRIRGYYCTNRDKCDYQFNCPISAWDEIATPDATYSSVNKPQNKPFFSVINYMVSHESYIWINKNKPMLVNQDSIHIPRYYPDIPVVRNDVGRKYSNIVELDRQIGVCLDDLEQKGLLDKTIIFFFSDHGGPLLRQKRAVGNSGLRVPLIVRFPDKCQAGTVCNDIVSLMDLGPTVMSLAGIRPPLYMQGKAFLGKYKISEKKKYHFGTADRFDESRDMARSVLDGRYVYIKNFYPGLPLIYRNKYREQIEMTRELIQLDKEGKLKGDAAYIFMKTKPEEELYDLLNDPDEVHNLAGLVQYQNKLKEMRNALYKWQKKIKDKGFTPELDLIESMWPGLTQPCTSDVEMKINKRKEIVLTCKTSGASIVYQIGTQLGSELWNLYHKPLIVKNGGKIRARAVRIGYKASPIINLVLENGSDKLDKNIN